MEWIELTAKSLEEAKDQLLDRLGVAEDEAEFDLVEEPKPGLFGRTRGLYRVRARVAPKAVRSREPQRRPKGDKSRSRQDGQRSKPAPKKESSQERPAAERAAANSPVRERSETVETLDVDTAVSAAKEFLSTLTNKMRIPAEVEVVVDEDGILQGSISGANLGRLIGPRGGMVAALEELTRTRLQHVGDGKMSPRFRLDVGGYRIERRATLDHAVRDAIADVQATGTHHSFDVAHAAERKFVHDLVAEAGDGKVATQSQGEEPNRRVVLFPTA